MRITNHPILDFKRGKEITFYYQKEPVKAFEGETIAAALYSQGVREFSLSPKKNRPRGFFCAIGKCSSCLMKVNGQPNVRTCVTLAKEGMEVGKQDGYAELPLVNESPNITPIPIQETDIAVIGGGPAGLKAALSAQKAGTSVILIDENPVLGGQLIKQTHKFFGSFEQDAGQRGIKIADKLIKKVKKCEDIEVRTGASAVGIYEDDIIGIYQRGKQFEKIKARKIISTTGASEKMVNFVNNDLPGVYGAGGVQTLMNVYGIRPGDRVLMIGAGNVGLIVSYQLLQAGVEVTAIVEALPEIGGYFVHAAKVRRQGVPILIGHTIIGVTGNDRVREATVVELDKKGNILEGSEKKFEVDAVTLAVGLFPSYRLIHQAGVKLKFAPELGGYVPLRDENMRTSLDNIYIAGDVAGIEEATTALLEGEIAGNSASLALGFGGARQEEKIKRAKADLVKLRAGSFYDQIREGLEKVRL